MDTVVTLHVTEEPVVDYASLQNLQKKIGLDQSKEIIERSIFELSDRLWLLEKAFFENNLEDARSVAQSFCAPAEEIGLVEFSKVASDLVSCIDICDFVATQAVATRLVRVGECALQHMVHLPEFSTY